MCVCLSVSGYGCGYGCMPHAALSLSLLTNILILPCLCLHPHTRIVSLLLFSLYVTDAWVLGNQPDSETPILDGLLTAVFVIFSLEVVILSLVEPNYVWSFFFYMDILGTLSIILDIHYISSSFLPSGTQASGSILRATRTAKLGTFVCVCVCVC